MANKDSLDAFKENQEETTVDTSRKLRVGIIGCGGIAHAHMRSYLHQPDVEVVAGCDLIPGRAKAFFEEFGKPEVKCDYKDHTEMLADKSLKLDAVSVCTYNRQHVCCSIAAMEAGLDVLLEKPMCVTMDEAAELLKAEKRTGRILSIGFQPRMDANMKKIKEIVESGVLGQIYYIQTGGGRRHGIPFYAESFIKDETAGLGALADIGCYSLDMVLNAIGYPKPLTVTGYKSAFFGQNPQYYYHADPGLAKKFTVDDFAAAFVRLEGGIILDFRIAWAMNLDTPGDTIIMGTKGSLRIPSTNCWNGSTGGPMTIYHEEAGMEVQTVIPVIEMKENLFDLKIRTFVDACKDRTAAPVPTSQILYNQAILSGIAESAEAGHEVDVYIPEI